MKRPIIEIEELGEPNSIIYRKDAQVSEIVNTEKMLMELNEQLRLPFIVGQNGLLKCPFCGSDAEIIEKTLKYVGHPIPTWPHVKCETIPDKLPCSAPNGLIFLVNSHIVSLFCQIAGRRKGCKPGSDDNNSFAHRYLNIICGTSILLNARL